MQKTNSLKSGKLVSSCRSTRRGLGLYSQHFTRSFPEGLTPSLSLPPQVRTGAAGSSMYRAMAAAASAFLSPFTAANTSRCSFTVRLGHSASSWGQYPRKPRGSPPLLPFRSTCRKKLPLRAFALVLFLFPVSFSLQTYKSYTISSPWLSVIICTHFALAERSSESRNMKTVCTTKI